MQKKILDISAKIFQISYNDIVDINDNVGVIDNDGLTEDELKARAYELYKQDQNRKENGTKYR